MSDSFSLNTINQAHAALGLPKPKHPLVTLVRARDVNPMTDFRQGKVVVNFYQVIYKKFGCGSIHYGRNSYDYDEGTLLFTAPGQVMEYEDNVEANNPESQDWTLAFHPDLIRKSLLGDNISSYSFFSYDVSEALHLSEEERETIEGLLSIITKEYSKNLDRHSQHLIVSNLQLLMDYCTRFYDRQFYIRTNINTDIISRFERLLIAYYQTQKASESGIPSVRFCAEELNLSPNYLSDLLKKETGKTAQEHIHLFVIEQAKTNLLNSSSSISEIGFSLGFEYPQHFSNLFKAKTGMSPREYRKSVRLN